MVHQGYKLKQILKEKGILQDDFAHKLGISRTYLLSIMEKPVLPEEYAHKSIKVLNISEYELNGPVAIKGKIMEQKLKHLGINTDAQNVRMVEIGGPRNNLTIVPLKAFGGFLSGYANKVF